MPTNTTLITTGDGARIAYRWDGDAGLPVLALSNSIGTTLRMWDDLVPALARHFRVLRFDTRGHGDSSVPAGPYSLDRLGRDVLELFDALGVERAHFLGLSLGGIIGQWLGVHAPDRIDRLILANTSPYLGPAPQWDERIAATLQAPDMKASAETFLANWFPAAMLQAGGPVIDTFRDMLLNLSLIHISRIGSLFAMVGGTAAQRSIGRGDQFQHRRAWRQHEDSWGSA